MCDAFISWSRWVYSETQPVFICCLVLEQKLENSCWLLGLDHPHRNQGCPPKCLSAAQGHFSTSASSQPRFLGQIEPVHLVWPSPALRSNPIHQPIVAGGWSGRGPDLPTSRFRIESETSDEYKHPTCIQRPALYSYPTLCRKSGDLLQSRHLTLVLGCVKPAAASIAVHSSYY